MKNFEQTEIKFEIKQNNGLNDLTNEHFNSDTISEKSTTINDLNNNQ